MHFEEMKALSVPCRRKRDHDHRRTSWNGLDDRSSTSPLPAITASGLRGACHGPRFAANPFALAGREARDSKKAPALRRGFDR
jgi:hypothetical protein